MRVYQVINLVTGHEILGHRDRQFSDVDVARFWAIKQSRDLGSPIALYDGDHALNVYQDGELIKYYFEGRE